MLVDHINPTKSSVLYAGSKNKESIFTEVTEAYQRLVGAEKSLVGLSDFETPCATSESAQEFFKQDRDVESTQKSLLCLDVHYYANSLSATFFRKSPKYADSNIIGTDFCGWDINSEDGNNVIALSIGLSIKLSKSNKSKIGQNSLIVTDKFDGLTMREFEILYLSSLKLTAKEIANGFEISHKTVEDHIYKIKEKLFFNGHKKDLIDFFVDEKKLHNYVPASFLLNSGDICKLIRY